jgi:hypothetical protein
MMSRHGKQQGVASDIQVRSTARTPNALPACRRDYGRTAFTVHCMNRSEGKAAMKQDKCISAGARMPLHFLLAKEWGTKGTVQQDMPTLGADPTGRSALLQASQDYEILMPHLRPLHADVCRCFCQFSSTWWRKYKIHQSVGRDVTTFRMAPR